MNCTHSQFEPLLNQGTTERPTPNQMRHQMRITIVYQQQLLQLLPQQQQEQQQHAAPGAWQCIAIVTTRRSGSSPGSKQLTSATRSPSSGLRGARVGS
eukprot:355528-Chlamydomonas_euryale.AAC.6